MKFAFILSGLLVWVNISVAAESIEDYAQRLRENFEASKHSTVGAHSPLITKSDAKPEMKPDMKPDVKPQQPTVKQLEKTVITVPEKNVEKPKYSEHRVPEVRDNNKAKPHHNEYHKQPLKRSDHFKPKPPRPLHPQPERVVYRTQIYAVPKSAVSYVTSSGGVVYNANPHIYTPNAYACSLKGDIKYCTDSIGKPLNGRVVQNYSDSIAYENYKKGYLSGEVSIYTIDGTLIQTVKYSKGLKNGKETVYFGNGRVHYVAHYSRGLLNGNVTQYDINGVLLGEMRYRNGHYTSRYCRNDTANDLLRERIRANEKNVLILCADN